MGFFVARMAAAEKIYKCGHCGATNDSLESLKQHMVEVHMPAAPQISPQFHSEPVEISHPAAIAVGKPMEVDAEPPPPLSEPAEKKGKFKCGHCGVIVTSMDGLKNHMIEAHVKDSETAKELSKPQNIPDKGTHTQYSLWNGGYNSCLYILSRFEFNFLFTAKKVEKSHSSVEAMPFDESNDGDGFSEPTANKVELNFSVSVLI